MKIPGLTAKPLLAIGVAALLGASAIGVAVADSTDSSSSVGAALSDSAITAKVKAKYATDSRLKGSDLSVETNNGVVTLTGTTASTNAKEAAESLAQNVSGVRRVNDQISAPSATGELASKAKHATRRTASAVKDSAITADLKTKYAADSKTHGSDVSVSTDNAIVALSGTVISEAQKNHMIYVARHTKGVTQVDSTALKVAAP
ncbi:MAG TPA: BON domain-containing protein [Steroidobacteraceae bacterium]